MGTRLFVKSPSSRTLGRVIATRSHASYINLIYI